MNYKTEPMQIEALKHTIMFGDLANVAATSVTLNLPLWCSNTYVIGVYGRVVTAFVGVTRPEVKVGYGTEDDVLIPLQHLSSIHQLKPGKAASGSGFCSGMVSPTGRGQGILLTIQSAATNLSSLSAGELEIVIVYAGNKRK